MERKTLDPGLFTAGRLSINRNESSGTPEEPWVDEQKPRSFSIVEERKTRTIEVQGGHECIDAGGKAYKSNKIKTSKYTWWSFVPYNIGIQFTKMANVYFLVVSILQCIPNITITEG